MFVRFANSLQIRVQTKSVMIRGSQFKKGVMIKANIGVKWISNAKLHGNGYGNGKRIRNGNGKRQNSEIQDTDTAEIRQYKNIKKIYIYILKKFHHLIY